MINPMELRGKVFLVTGASSGIGRETSILLGQLGAKVILVGRNGQEIEKTRSMLEGTDHLIEMMDLASVVEGIPGWMKELVKKSGPLNGVVHAAGAQFLRPLKIVTGANLEDMMRINVTAALALAKGFRQKGVCHPNGSLVFLSSVMGLVGQPGQSAYAATKSALIGLTKSLALELAREDIRVNCVAPAIVQTEMSERMFKDLSEEQILQIKSRHPLGLGNPRDVALAIAFLLAETSRWITGITLVVDGGYTAH